MSERLSDQALKMAQDAAHQMMDGHHVDAAERAVQGAIVDLVLKELRERRAADLTDEDVDMLADLQGRINANNDRENEPRQGEHVAVIRKLLRNKP